MRGSAKTAESTRDDRWARTILPSKLKDELMAFVDAHPELGIQTFAEAVRRAVAEWLQAKKDAGTRRFAEDDLMRLLEELQRKRRR